MYSTIKDVAKRSGCALATVSRYINGGGVREANRLRIEEAIAALDFRPNGVAQGLRSRRTNAVGIVLPELSNLFSMHIIGATESFLRKRGYSVLVCNSARSEREERNRLRFLVDKKVDGIILMPFADTSSQVLAETEGKVPVVLVDKLFSDCRFDAAILKNEEAAYLAASELFKQTDRTALLCADDYYTGALRKRGFLNAQKEYGGIPRPEWIVDSENSIEGATEAFTKLWAQKDRPRAALATNYETTVGLLRAVNRLKIRVPEELTVFGFDNLELAGVIREPMRILCQPMEQMGTRAAELLLSRIEGMGNPEPEIDELSAEIMGCGEGENV